MTEHTQGSSEPSEAPSQPESGNTISPLPGEAGIPNVARRQPLYLSWKNISVIGLVVLMVTAMCVLYGYRYFADSGDAEKDKSLLRDRPSAAGAGTRQLDMTQPVKPRVPALVPTPAEVADPISLRHSGTAAPSGPKTLSPDDAPVLRWEWIEAMEASGSATRERGWEAAHFTLWRGDTLIAAAPAYRKHHSMGEYVYDFGWANAAQQLGVRYYPKLLVGLPLSPLTARRFLIAPGEDEAQLRRALRSPSPATHASRPCTSLMRTTAGSMCLALALCLGCTSAEPPPQELTPEAGLTHPELAALRDLLRASPPQSAGH